MLSDPQSLTVNAVPISHPAISRGDGKSVYRSADGAHELVISGNFAKRDRIMARVNQTKSATDPLTAATAEVSQSVYLVMDRPAWGFSADETDDLVQALATWLASATVVRLIGGES